MRGGSSWFFGFGTLLLFSVVLFVVIYLLSPGLGNQVLDAVSKLFSAIRGA